MAITKDQYDFALQRIEELLPIVDDSTAANDRNAVELRLVSDVVIEYEKEHFPIAKPTVGQLIELALEEKGMTQKQLAQELDISPSAVNFYVSGKALPRLDVAGKICRILDIQPALMLGM